MINTRNIDLISKTRNPKGMTVTELEHRVAQCAGFVKMMTGVANNAAISIMMDCHDRLKQHPAYRQQVKRLFKATAIDERKNYRSSLLNPALGDIRFFNISDMPDEVRRKYGAVTDAEYFEFWEGTGALAYDRSKPFVGSLHNKFRLSMQNHGVPHADIVAWGLVGAAVLELAVTVWQMTMQSIHEACEGILSMKQIEAIYKPFCIMRISASWQRALKQMAPETATYDLDAEEERNVALGVEQLRELWMSPDLPFDSTIRAVEDFSDDIFLTKGYARKSARELAEMRDSTVRELQNHQKN